MMKHFFSFGLLILTMRMWLGFTRPEAPVNNPPQVIQDPATKVVYYLESDRRHVSAIGSDGQLLWCCTVIPEAEKRWHYVEEIGLFPPGIKDGFIRVSIFVTGQGSGEINKQTGAWKQAPEVQ